MTEVRSDVPEGRSGLEEGAIATSRATARYRFGFVLTTAAGNMTRYLNLRKYADRDPEVECVWAPVKHYLVPDPFRMLPGPLRTRAVVMREAAPVTKRMGEMDAVMYHAFEPYVASLLRHRLGRRPLVVWSQDNPPLPPDDRDPSLPRYGGTHARSDRRRRARFQFDQWCLRRTDLFVPYSRWCGDMLVARSGVVPERVGPTSVGLDLELWPYQPKVEIERETERRLQILFVGGDFVRKGGDLLLLVWREHFRSVADLHLVTRNPPSDLPTEGVTVYTDMTTNDPRLISLYAESDLFVLPTRADVSSWVAMEGMATGRPVIATRMGGIPDIVRDGETGYLIAPDDGAALKYTIGRLVGDPDLRNALGNEGRRVVESNFDAAVCVPRILTFLKRAVDVSRSQVRERS